MSKKKKTKRQKLISDLRKKLQETSSDIPASTLITKPTSFSLQHVTIPRIEPTKANTINVKDYAYVTSDIIKTASITSVLIGANILLFILTEKNILKFTFLGL